ncbi:alpha/beta hydrolase [Blastococcus sp. MG754426]|uniref:alpha/beta fold hydrolase n=1 Tax=unclassified Blastococcus TaxID=2619396 RepID=UPI001EF0EF2A|nr:MULTISPECIES: alpha/beta hydrolase [unclassified Blastococcus]MCF6506320.1 alpha/beta hydrolase [Blastococcus sp. MG754426]MCF6510864.1 alpha/beta hydrolase [Blastococcus sp. MG754427]
MTTRTTPGAIARSTRSRDGTAIAWWTSGTGPDLLLVHGTTADHTRWEVMTPLLEPHVTVHAMDHRGRGGSGDAPDYSLAAEADDVAAVVDAIGGPVDVFGHSQGALCTLEASLRTSGMRRMVLYEPPIEVAAPPEVRRRVAELVARGRRDEAVGVFLREVAGLTDDQLARARTLPSWAARVAAAHTAVREEEVSAAYRFDPARFARSAVPTLLLDGTESPPDLREGTARVAAALPGARVTRLEGHGHVAMLTDPELVVREVLAFLAG